MNGAIVTKDLLWARPLSGLRKPRTTRWGCGTVSAPLQESDLMLAFSHLSPLQLSRWTAPGPRPPHLCSTSPTGTPVSAQTASDKGGERAFRGRGSPSLALQDVLPVDPTAGPRTVGLQEGPIVSACESQTRTSWAVWSGCGVPWDTCLRQRQESPWKPSKGQRLPLCLRTPRLSATQTLMSACLVVLRWRLCPRGCDLGRPRGTQTPMSPLCLRGASARPRCSRSS